MKLATRWLPLLVLVAGCDLPGKPDPADKFVAPTKVLDFAKLYAKNCAGCHGADGKFGPAPPLHDPLFLAIVPDNELVKVIAEGRIGTEMPAFAIDQGGTLTTEQVKVLAAGLRKEWSGAAPKTESHPYLLPAKKGNVEHGKTVFARVCADCHGKDGHINPDYGALNNSAFLNLASEQMLRRIVITGRSDLGMPAAAKHDSGPLSDSDINDVVALLISWKHEAPKK